MTPEEQELVAAIPADGSWLTNPEVQRHLGPSWDSDRYWTVRNVLVDRGELEIARGRGGLIRRVLEAVETPSPTTAATAALLQFEREEDLYEPIRKVLDDQWSREKRLERWMVNISARQGRKETGGRWSRPDLMLAAQTSYPYVPGRHFDVITFEVKPVSDLDVRAVYEALAHLRAATKAYVLLHLPEARSDEFQEAINEINAEAKKHGVGVIVMDQPGDFSGWNETVEPQRREPEPGRLNDFLAAVLDPTQRETLLRWFR